MMSIAIWIEGSAPNTADHSYRMLKGTIFLVAFVLINSYTCNLISHLTVIKMKPAIESFQDLAASQELSVIVEKDSVLHRTLMASHHRYLIHHSRQQKQKQQQRFELIDNIDTNSFELIGRSIGLRLTGSQVWAVQNHRRHSAQESGQRVQHSRRSLEINQNGSPRRSRRTDQFLIHFDLNNSQIFFSIWRYFW